MASATPKVVFLMADYGHDPTETAVPYTIFKKAGFDVKFATENAKVPQCDKKMYEGIAQKLLGANKSAVHMYHDMKKSEECNSPLSWSSEGFTLDPFDLVFLPGGHEKSVRQVIDSEIVHKLLASYFPQTKTPGKKAVAAICHGVMVLSESKDVDGISVIHDCTTTALPARMEQPIFWLTRPFLGDYYKTYGSGSEAVEESVRKVLRNHGDQYKNSLSPQPFVVEDPNYNYVSGRFPPDSQLLAEKAVQMIKSLR